MTFKHHAHCRVCDNPLGEPYLDLGFMPLSNNLMNTASEKPVRYPLEVLFCDHCFLSQLSIVVDPAVMFSNYVYRSGISEGYKAHCRQMATDLRAFGINDQSSHIDIAGNDGTLLKQFRSTLGGDYSKRFVVDPASNFYDENKALGIGQLTEFWDEAAAKYFASRCNGIDLITATNVFAHVDDVKGFLTAAHMALNKTGILVLEFPYLADFIDKKEFDTIYFEHLSYFSLTPLMKLANDCGLCILDATRHEIHGGSLRVVLGKTGSINEKNVDQILQLEYDKKLNQRKTYIDWAKDVETIKNRFRHGLIRLAVNGARIAGFAASAKGNVLLNSAGITSTYMQYIIDETPEKKGKFSPGTGIPISDFGYQYTWPDYLVVLSWNFFEEIRSKCRRLGYQGKFIKPLTFEICD